MTEFQFEFGYVSFEFIIHFIWNHYKPELPIIGNFSQVHLTVDLNQAYS